VPLGRVSYDQRGIGIPVSRRRTSQDGHEILDAAVAQKLTGCLTR